MTGQEYLHQIKKIDTLIKNKALDIEQAERLGIDTSYYKNSIKQLEGTRREILNNMELLTEPEYDVLHRVYIQGQSLYEVASDRDICYRNACSIHGRALQHLEKVIKSE